MLPPCQQILATATGIAEHVRIEDLYRACSHDCLGEVLRLGPPPSPAASQQAWDKVLQWGTCTLHIRMQAPEVGWGATVGQWMKAAVQGLPGRVVVVAVVIALLCWPQRPPPAS